MSLPTNVLPIPAKKAQVKNWTTPNILSKGRLLCLGRYLGLYVSGIGNLDRSVVRDGSFSTNPLFCLEFVDVANKLISPLGLKSSSTSFLSCAASLAEKLFSAGIRFIPPLRRNACASVIVSVSR